MPAVPAAPSDPSPAPPTRPPPPPLLVPCVTPNALDPVDPKPAGTTVSAGEALTQATPHAAPAALAPVAGRILGTNRVTLAGGREAAAVLLEPAAPPPAPPALDAGTSEMTDDERRRIVRAVDAARPADFAAAVDRLRLAGVWADRWASPDLLGQLHQCLRRPVDMLVCCALDEDPAAAPLQSTIATRHAADVATGAALLARLAGASNTRLVVDAAGGEEYLSAAARWAADTGLRLVALHNNYPQANPSLLLHVVAGRRLRPGTPPTAVGVLLLDAAAAAAAGACLLRGEPALHVPLAVYDTVNARTHLARVPVGTSVRDALAGLGVRWSGVALRAGRPLRDVRCAPDTVLSAGGELTIYTLPPPRDVNPDPCIRCGWCSTRCPVLIDPAGILEAAQSNDRDAADRSGLESCIECGVCNYVCPSRLPLLEGIRVFRR